MKMCASERCNVLTNVICSGTKSRHNANLTYNVLRVIWKEVFPNWIKTRKMYVILKFESNRNFVKCCMQLRNTTSEFGKKTPITSSQYYKCFKFSDTTIQLTSIFAILQSLDPDSSYIPDVYDELLTQAEIQGNINKSNSMYPLPTHIIMETSYLVLIFRYTPAICWLHF